MMTPERHHSTHAPFCPMTSAYPHIDYSDMARRACITYPGARGDAVLALSFAAKHLEMSIERAVLHYSAAAHKQDRHEYARNWVDRQLDYLECDE